MSAFDSGVDLLFRRATDQLRPDVDRLVAGGLDRGRTRRRRHLAGTTVAVVATFSVLGAAAALAPQLRPEPVGGLHVATGPDTSTALPSPSATPAPTPATSPLSQPAPPTVAAADIPRRVSGLLGGHDVSGPLTNHPYALVDTRNEKVVHFRVDGMLTTVIISRASASLAHDCVRDPIVACRELADGTDLQVAGPTTNDRVTMRDVLALGELWMVDVMSYNAAEGKDADPVQPEPALGEQELVLLASSDAWFE